MAGDDGRFWGWIMTERRVRQSVRLLTAAWPVSGNSNHGPTVPPADAAKQLAKKPAVVAETPWGASKAAPVAATFLPAFTQLGARPSRRRRGT